jgi:uncharacterized protein (DUF305 family)
MASPMVLIELLLMGSMYPEKRLNWIIGAAGIAAGLIFFLLIRQQVAVTDTQFLRSMIPHHAGAILMCEKAPLQDAGIKKLCSTIIKSQQGEISEMKAKLNALNP